LLLLGSRQRRASQYFNL